MGSELNINVHDIIRKYSLPISRVGQSIKECLRNFYRGLCMDLKGVIAKEYPDDFPLYFYNDLSNKNLSLIINECSMILNILTLDNKDYQLKKFDELMWLLVNNNAFRVNEFDKQPKQ